MRVTTAQGELRARDVVMALGAWSPKLADAIGAPALKRTMQPGKGYSITYSSPTLVPRRPLVLRERQVCVTAWDSGFRLGSTMEFSGYDDSLNPRRLAALERGASEYLHEPVGAQKQEQWFGWRPMTCDDVPIIGRVPGRDHVWLATGHGMIGVSMSTATGAADRRPDRRPRAGDRPDALSHRAFRMKPDASCQRLRPDRDRRRLRRPGRRVPRRRARRARGAARAAACSAAPASTSAACRRRRCGWRPSVAEQAASWRRRLGFPVQPQPLDWREFIVHRQRYIETSMPATGGASTRPASSLMPQRVHACSTRARCECQNGTRLRAPPHPDRHRRTAAAAGDPRRGTGRRIRRFLPVARRARARGDRRRRLHRGRTGRGAAGTRQPRRSVRARHAPAQGLRRRT